MAALTIRLTKDKLARLKALSKHRGISVNRLFDELTTIMLAEFDAETRFRVRVAEGAGKRARALALLEKARGNPA